MIIANLLSSTSRSLRLPTRSLSFITSNHHPQVASQTRSYNHKPKRFPRMSAVSQQAILDRLSALQINHSGVIEHSAVKNGEEWRAALESSEAAVKAGGEGWELTKTVSGWSIRP